MASLFSNTYAHRYAWAGLQVLSKIALPDLFATLALQPDAPGLRIGGRIANSPQELGALADPSWEDLQPAQIRLHRQNLATVFICSEHITVLAHPSADPESLQHFICKRALPALGRLRKMFSLHASAVATPRGAALFVGAAKAGKTSLATCLHSMGTPVIADDPCMLWLDQGRVMTAPTIGTPSSVPPKLSAYVPKEAIPNRHNRASTGFEQRRVSNIFMLSGPTPQASVGATPMTANEGMAALVRHNFTTNAPDQIPVHLPFVHASKAFEELNFWRLNLPEELREAPTLARDLIRMIIGSSARTINPPTPIFAPISRAS